MRPISLPPAWTLFLFAVALVTGAGEPSVFAEEELDETPEFYQYTHEDGTVVFTDDPEKIPHEYRSSATPVSLPPLVTLPPPKPTPMDKGPSRATRIKTWYAHLSPLTKVAVGGILPIIVISLWGFYFLGGKTDNPAAKLILKLGMAVIIAGSVYLLYFIFMKAYAEKMTKGLPIQIDTSAPPHKMLEPIRKEEENRLQKIEDIANLP